MVSPFDSLFHAATRQINYPPVNAYHGDNGDIVVEAAVAGFYKDELSVEYENGTLTLSGKKEDKVPDVEYIIKGIATRSFSRSFTVQGSYELVSAELSNGILTVQLKNVSERKKVKILVK